VTHDTSIKKANQTRDSASSELILAFVFNISAPCRL
jgi:hypothetical protein